MREANVSSFPIQLDGICAWNYSDRATPIMGKNKERRKFIGGKGKDVLQCMHSMLTENNELKGSLWSRYLKEELQCDFSVEF